MSENESTADVNPLDGKFVSYVAVPLQGHNTSMVSLVDAITGGEMKTLIAKVEKELDGKATISSLADKTAGLSLNVKRLNGQDNRGYGFTVYNDEAWQAELYKLLKPQATARVNASACVRRDNDGNFEGTFLTVSVIEGTTAITRNNVNAIDAITGGKVIKRGGEIYGVKFLLKGEVTDEDEVTEIAQRVCKKLGLSLTTSLVPVADNDEDALLAEARRDSDTSDAE